MPVQLTPLPADLFDEWRAATRQRLIALDQESGTHPGADAIAHAEEFLGELLPAGPETPRARILLIEDERGAIARSGPA